MTSDERRLLEEKYAGDASAPGFAHDCERLATGEPLAYVIGWQPFLGLKISLDSHPLIPRPETEWWAEQLLNTLSGGGDAGSGVSAARSGMVISAPKGSCAEIREGEGKRVPSLGGTTRLPNPRRRSFLDLCAGSGAIGCAALKTLPDAEVFFGEIDPMHEATIHKNIRENDLDEARSHLFIGDLFEPFPPEMRFDIIAANPPYIPEGRILDPSVADHEPTRALYAGEDGLALIRRIAEELPQRLAPGGRAWIECDEAHAEEARALFTAQGFSASILPDQYSVPRVIVVEWP